MNKDSSPLRRKLGVELRRLRQAADISADQAARRLELSASTISRGETGIVTIHPRDVDAMLRLYGLRDGPKRDALLALARKSRERGWWHQYRNVLSSNMVSYISVEYGANTISSFQNMLLPGFFQTEDYTRAVAAILPRKARPEVVEQLVKIRLQRQQMLLERDDPIPLHVVLDESLLHRPIGGNNVMKSQLKKLLDYAGRDHIMLRVVSAETGMYPGLAGPFTLFGFAEPMDLAIVHVENHLNFLLVEAESDIRHYELVFKRIADAAQSEDESLTLIDEAANKL